MNTRALLLTTLLTLPLLRLYPVETFRVRSIIPIELTSTEKAQTIELGYNDAIGIKFSDQTTFLRAIEIEIKIPQEILTYRNSLAWGLYDNLSPQPSEKIIDYKGNQLALNPLPSRLSFVLQIPLKKNHDLKSGPYSTVLPTVIDPKAGPLLFRLLPVMKGLPDNIENIKFTVKIKPILIEEGGVSVRILKPTDTSYPVSVRIDENLITKPENLHILKPGSHHLSIVSDEYRNEVRVFTIESARITELEILLKDTTPRLIFTAPENAQLTINDVQTEISKDPLIIDPGTYVLKFTLGDWELSKHIVLEKGRDYAVALKIDIEIAESP